MNGEAPPLVTRALALAEELGFQGSCIPEVGRLLRALAATIRGVAGEAGTGVGTGAAWIASGLPPEARLVTVEIDPERAARARQLLAADPRIEVLVGDWRLLLERGPFSLLFIDASHAKQEADALVAELAPGGIALLDDLTPEEHWPPEWRGRPDPVRDTWLQHPALHAVEVRTTARTSAILAVRRA